MQKDKILKETTESWCEDCFKRTNVELIKILIPLVNQFVDIDKQNRMGKNLKLETDTLAQFSFIQCLLSWRQMSANEWQSLKARTGVSRDQLVHWANEAREESINDKNAKPIFLVMAGYYYYRQFDHPKSIELCNKALKIRPNLRSAHLICAKSLCDKNIQEKSQKSKLFNAKKGIEHLDKYIKLSNDQNRKVMYVHFHTTLKNFNKATAYLDALIGEGIRLKKPKDEIDKYINWKKNISAKASGNKI